VIQICQSIQPFEA
jgi:hypothetical protein